ncbi:MAG: hypothetical protein MPW14_11450 [Candidatus Manganitrophus sp.]|nr:MAG: hypothetical protein MPW14_11450 [Candidatus Manganitrophus sp.]
MQFVDHRLIEGHQGVAELQAVLAPIEIGIDHHALGQNGSAVVRSSKVRSSSGFSI